MTTTIEPNPHRLLKHAKLVHETFEKSFAFRRANPVNNGKPFRKWETDLHQASVVALSSTALNPLLLVRLAKDTTVYLHRRAYRKNCKKSGLKNWERVLLASAYGALGQEPLKLPGTQALPKSPHYDKAWWRTLFPNETYGMGQFCSDGLVIARVHKKVRDSATPQPSRDFVTVHGSPKAARELLAALTAHVATLPAE